MDAGLGAADAIKAALLCGYVCAAYPLIELRHAGPPVIWISETERGDPAEFFAACGVDQAEFIQAVGPVAMAAE